MSQACRLIIPTTAAIKRYNTVFIGVIPKTNTVYLYSSLRETVYLRSVSVCIEQSFECSAIDRSMLRPEGNDAQGRQSELRLELLAVDLIGFGVHAAKVSQITPTVNFGVAVQDFAPESPFGKSNPVIMSRN